MQVLDIAFLDTATLVWQLAQQHSTQYQAHSRAGIPNLGGHPAPRIISERAADDACTQDVRIIARCILDTIKMAPGGHPCALASPILMSPGFIAVHVLNV